MTKGLDEKVFCDFGAGKSLKNAPNPDGKRGFG